MVLLTATITPGVPGVMVQDPATRRSQYRLALDRWLRYGSRHDVDVVFVENSDEDLDALASGLPKGRARGLTLLSAPRPTIPVLARGKGAAEAEMIDYAVQALEGLQDSLLIKCTGRLFVSNLMRSVAGVDRSSSAMLLRRTLDWSYADTRCIAASGTVWASHLSGMSVDVCEPDGEYLEHALARRATLAHASGTVTVRPFSARPRLVGSSATTGHRYDSALGDAQRLAALPLERLLRGPLRRKQY